MSSQTIPANPIQKAVKKSEAFEEKSASVIKKYTLIAGGAALVPYDYVDVITSTVSQTMMIKELCEIYNVPFSEKMVNTAFWSATGSLLIKAISSVVRNVLDTTGQGSGNIDLSGAAVTAIYTATVGEFYKTHFRDGGTLNDIDIADFSTFFVEEIKNGDISVSTFTNPKALMNHLNI